MIGGMTRWFKDTPLRPALGLPLVPARPEERVREHDATAGEYDVFISHATEDKEDVVRPLAAALVSAGLRVWYDEFELRIGDNLRRKIDAESR